MHIIETHFSVPPGINTLLHQFLQDMIQDILQTLNGIILNN